MRTTLLGCMFLVALLAVACNNGGGGGGKLDLSGVSHAGLTLGDQGVEVKLYENIGCETCQTFEQDVLPRIVDNYVKTGDIKITFVHAAIGTEPEIMFAHGAAQCAAEQDKFWEYLDIIYSHKSSEISTKEKLKNYADEAGLDRATFDPCLDGDETQSKIQADLQTLQALAPGYFLGLPVFQIDQLILAGSYSYDGIKFFLDENLGQQ